MKTLIYPSLLSCDFGKFREEALAVEKAGADGLHLDVMDGVFVPNLTFGAPVISSLKNHIKIPLDCHLMVQKPETLINDFHLSGASHITVHQEACTHLQRTLRQIKDLGLTSGASLNPATPYESLEWVLDDLDLILCMTVNPGFGGQSLIPAALKKAGELKKWLVKKNKPLIKVQIDGGVNSTTAAQARSLGIDILVAGSSIFNSSNYAQSISQLRG